MDFVNLPALPHFEMTFTKKRFSRSFLGNLLIKCYHSKTLRVLGLQRIVPRTFLSQNGPGESIFEVFDISTKPYSELSFQLNVLPLICYLVFSSSECKCVFRSHIYVRSTCGTCSNGSVHKSAPRGFIFWHSQ